MAHSVSEAAARAVKNSQKKVVETRTPEDIFKAIRGNLAAHLAVTPNDTAFLLGAFDGQQRANMILDADLIAAKNENGQLRIMLNAADEGLQKTREERNDLARQVVELQAKNEEFRTVYEQENRSQTLRVDVLATADPEAAL